jgi:hypothetical protein
LISKRIAKVYKLIISAYKSFDFILAFPIDASFILGILGKFEFNFEKSPCKSLAFPKEHAILVRFKWHEEITFWMPSRILFSSLGSSRSKLHPWKI